MKISEKINKIGLNIPDYSLLILALIIIYSAVIYYLYALNWLSIIIILGLTSISFFMLYRHLFKSENSPENSQESSRESDLQAKISNKLPLWQYGLYLIYFAFWIINIYLLYTSQSSRALISPWQVVNSNFFYVYVISSLVLIFIITQKRISSTAKLLLISLHYFLSFSVVLIIYKIGYGFDPFIHSATMELIDKKCLVTPKPLYYLGEYGLLVTVHKLTGASLYILNKFLVPILTAIFLPRAIANLLNKNTSNSSRFLTTLFILILSFSPFIVTTPQNLSYLFLILSILFGLTKNNQLWSLILALATLAIHPLTGIPAIGWWLASVLLKNKDILKKTSYRLLKYILFTLNALLLPLALFLGGGGDLKKISWSISLIYEPIKNLFINVNSAGQENWLYNFIYFFFYNYPLWLILIIIVSLFWFFKQFKETNYNSLIFINLSLIIAYVFSSQIIFIDLINYEQANFASRLLIIIIIFFLPFLISSLQKIIQLIEAQNIFLKTIWLVLGLMLLTTTLYVSYPRYDVYFNSRGYSTSQDDIEAVKNIQENATGPYIVLANQQVSVAALKELGFDNYFPTPGGQIFFYPIPTGGQLYQYYLDMVYKKPSRETMAQARSLAGVSESYLIINKYWYQSGRLINEAKLSANSWQNINNEVYIFKYLP